MISARQTSTGLVQAKVLGGFAVTVDGRPVPPSDWRRISAVRLVKLLLVTNGHTISREAAAEELWPEADPAHQAVNLRKAVHFARRALEPTGDAPEILTTDHHLLGLEDAALDLDLDRLRDAIEVLDDRASHTTDAIVAARDTVLALGADDLLPDDPYEDWLAGERERLSSRWRDTALGVASERISAGSAETAQPLLDQVLLRDPADEDAHRLAIELHGSLGQHHAARRQFFRCRTELAALGIAPSSETVGALGAAEAAALTRPRRVVSGGGELVGRQAELTRLELAFDRIAAGRPAVLVVRGPAGIGKSRLLEEVAHYGDSSGWHVLEARAVQSAPGLSFAPVGEALAGTLRREAVAAWPEPAASAAATLVPALGLEPALPFKQPRALATAVGEVIGRLVATAPVALLIDDGQWLDDGSADLLADVAHRTVDRPLLVAVSLRSDEPRSAAVEELVDRLSAMPGAEGLDLAPLRGRDVPALVVRHLGGARVDGRLATFLVEHSGGNPLFCLELARDGRDRGSIDLEGATWRQRQPDEPAHVPRGVARLVAGRCARLRTETVRILALSAELGDLIDYELASRAAGAEPEAVVGAIDEALEASLVVEARGGYRFAHPLFRAALQGQTARSQRGPMMLSLARALAGEADPRDPAAVRAAVAAGVDPVGVADRALNAVEDGVAEARPLGIAFGFAAAAGQIRLSDRQGARRILGLALEAWKRLPSPDQSAYEASTAWWMLGEILAHTGDEGSAEAAFREAIATARNAEQMGTAYRGLAWLPYRHGDYESAIAILDEGIALHEDDEVLRGVLMMEAGFLNFRHQRLDESLAQLEAAEAILARAGSDVLRMEVLDCLWGPLESLGRGDETLAGLNEALAIALRLRDVSWEARIRTHIGFRMVIGGTPGRARPHLDRAIWVADMVGDPYMESVATWASAEMAYALGDDVTAQGLRRRELELLAGLGGNVRHEALAHVHLAHIARRADRHDAMREEEALARALAAEASATNPDFGRRIDAYLAAERWQPMSQ